ncbi:hypothetical protein GTY82_29835 [Streptomyces sp. SID5476]|nr:hypothetical protein [Streptomyces sp. SID5476]
MRGDGVRRNGVRRNGLRAGLAGAVLCGVRGAGCGVRGAACGATGDGVPPAPAAARWAGLPLGRQVCAVARRCAARACA